MAQELINRALERQAAGPSDGSSGEEDRCSSCRGPGEVEAQDSPRILSRHGLRAVEHVLQRDPTLKFPHEL